MDHNSQPLLSRLPQTEMPMDLTARVLKAIQAAKARWIWNRLALAAFGLVVSLSYATSNRSALWQELRSSSFISLLRMAISDPDVALGNLNDFFLGLLEALPFGSILLILTGSFFLIGAVALANALRTAKQNRSPDYPLALN